MALAGEIEARERAVWQALVAGDAKADLAALTEDFLGVYSDGFAGRAEHVGQLATGPSVTRFALSDVQVRALGPDHALIAYRADFLRPGREAQDAIYVSSVWRRSGDGWVNLFSQDTVAVDLSRR